jgi:hypothetical protein
MIFHSLSDQGTVSQLLAYAYIMFANHTVIVRLVPGGFTTKTSAINTGE